MGLTLVSLAGLALGAKRSARSMLQTLSEVKTMLVRVRTKTRGRRATVALAPELDAEQRRCARIFELGRWMPVPLSSSS